MPRKSRASATSRNRQRALREKRQQKLERRQERRDGKADGAPKDELDGIVPGPQAIPWEEYGLPPLEKGAKGGDEEKKDDAG